MLGDITKQLKPVQKVHVSKLEVLQWCSFFIWVYIYFATVVLVRVFIRLDTIDDNSSSSGKMSTLVTPSYQSLGRVPEVTSTQRCQDLLSGQNLIVETEPV